jgi:MazG family protein
VLDRLSTKLVDRHPHVFGNVKADTSSEVLRNWEALKAEEKKKRAEAQGKIENQAPKSVLAGVSTAMPALMEAHKLSSKAANVGFDWPNIAGLFDKLREETEELQEHLKQLPSPAPRGVAEAEPRKIPDDLREKLEGELGDLFFVLVNLARFLSLDSESALKKTNRKFRKRFQSIEEQLRNAGRTPEQSNMEELETLWQSAKQTER